MCVFGSRTLHMLRTLTLPYSWASQNSITPNTASLGERPNSKSKACFLLNELSFLHNHKVLHN
jgi:hypothetical protein